MDNTTCNVHKLVADVALLGDGKVLLVKYKDTSKYDNQEGWFLPDDFLAHLEHPNDGARRIVREQVGLAIDDIRLNHIESFEGNGAWHLVFHFKAELATLPTVALAEKIKAMQWFQFDQLPAPSDVSHHGWALNVLNRMLGPQHRMD